MCTDTHAFTRDLQSQQYTCLFDVWRLAPGLQAGYHTVAVLMMSLAPECNYFLSNVLINQPVNYSHSILLVIRILSERRSDFCRSSELKVSFINNIGGF